MAVTGTYLGRCAARTRARRLHTAGRPARRLRSFVRYVWHAVEERTSPYYSGACWIQQQEVDGTNPKSKKTPPDDPQAGTPTPPLLSVWCTCIASHCMLV